MLIRWLQSLLRSGSVPMPSAETSAPAPTKAQLLDVAHEAAKSRAASLGHLIQAGVPIAGQQRRRQQIKKRVTRHLDSVFQGDEGLIDEITERVFDASLYDKTIAKLTTEQEN